MGGGCAVQHPAAPLMRLIPSRDGRKVRERATSVLAEHAVPGRPAYAKTLLCSSCSLGSGKARTLPALSRPSKGASGGKCGRSRQRRSLEGHSLDFYTKMENSGKL